MLLPTKTVGERMEGNLIFAGSNGFLNSYVDWYCIPSAITPLGKEKALALQQKSCRHTHRPSNDILFLNPSSNY